MKFNYSNEQFNQIIQPLIELGLKLTPHFRSTCGSIVFEDPNMRVIQGKKIASVYYAISPKGFVRRIFVYQYELLNRHEKDRNMLYSRVLCSSLEESVERIVNAVKRYKKLHSDGIVIISAGMGYGYPVHKHYTEMVRASGRITNHLINKSVRELDNISMNVDTEFGNTIRRATSRLITVSNEHSQMRELLNLVANGIYQYDEKHTVQQKAQLVILDIYNRENEDEK